MKFSSSTLCGCCFCCYCHCWLMMLLMVSSIVHVSPEISTTTITTPKKYIKVNNNDNNYTYQSTMTEFVPLNRKMPNRTNGTTTSKSFLSSSFLKPLARITPTTTTTTTYDYRKNNVKSFKIFGAHKAITTIAGKQKESATIRTAKNTITSREAILPLEKIKTNQSPSAPEQIQMTKQQNLYDAIERVTVGARDNRIKRYEHKQKNIHEEVKTTTLRTTATTTSTNYVADNNNNAFVTQKAKFKIRATKVKPFKGIIAHNNSNKNNRGNNDKIVNNCSTSIDLSPKIRKKQQHLYNMNSRNIRGSKSDGSISNSNIKNHNNNTRQKTTNTLSLNPNNEYERVKISGRMTSEIENGVKTAAAVTTLRVTMPTNSNQSETTTAEKNITATSSSGVINSLQTSTGNNFKNHINNSTVTTRRAGDSNLHQKEINSNSNDPNHLLLQTSTELTTTESSEVRALKTSSHIHEHHRYSQIKRPVFLHRRTRQSSANDEQNDKCRMFVEGDQGKNELYSPDYPNDYPKNINCTRVITAPKGQIIRLDFRNSFHIEEKEECKFDFLEIRDGQYGFSNLIGKYCGTDFPPEITSKERYLWLHFHSDESIEYSGFTAVYEFIDRNRDAPSTDLNCTIEKDGFEGFINSTDVPPEIRETVIRNKIPLDCMWRIQVQDKWKIQVKFVDFKLAKPNDCETNFLDIFPEQTVMPLRVKNFCGSAGEGITSDSNILHMRFYAEQSAINSTFSILYTAFRDRGGSNCIEGEYDCEDATCISSELKCNGRDNCKFRWDEEGCKSEDEGQSEHMIIIITVFGLILGGMIVTFLVNCVRKILRDQKIIREHIRQSKESKLDEMGRSSKARSRDNISIVSPRQKHSQTSLQILDDVSNRYYHEMELQTKSNFKEKDPNILRHDMIVQTSLCSTDDSSTTTTEPQQHQRLQQTSTDSVGNNACDMGCQTRESLFATASLMRQKSKTASTAGSQHTIEGVPPPPRFSTFGYDAAQITPPPPPTVSTLSRRNMHLPQETPEMEQLPYQTKHTLLMMPHHQQQQQKQPIQHQQPHQHLHHRHSQEICHHHHQHQQHLQQQKQALPHPHQQQLLLQQQEQQQPHYQHLQKQQQHHHTNTTTIPTNITQLPIQSTTIATGISTGSSGRHKEQTSGTGVVGKNKPTKVDESKMFMDIRNSAPDVIIMTSH